MLVDLYDTELQKAWCRIYSSMLTIIIPVAVMSELQDHEGQDRRFVGKTIHSFSFKGSAKSVKDSKVADKNNSLVHTKMSRKLSNQWRIVPFQSSK